MATVDIFILIIVGVSCVYGLFRGLIKEALSLAFWIAAIVAAGMFNAQAGQLLSGAISSPGLQKVVGFVLIFVVVVFAGALISNLVSKLFSVAGLAVADRALGGLFGVVRGLVIVTIIVMLTARFSFTQEFYSQSLAMPYIAGMAEMLQEWFDLVPSQSGPPVAA